MLRRFGNRPLQRIALTLSLGLTVLAIASAQAAQITPPPVPTTIQVPEGNRPYLVLHAVGTQNYTCTGAGTWGPAVPQADLFDEQGRKVGNHFAGPTWQYKDGSLVRAARVNGETVTEGAIQWLLLQVTSQQAGEDGERLVRTTYIQRLSTVGGLPPAGTCSAGDVVSVPYEADYYFFRPATGE